MTQTPQDNPTTPGGPSTEEGKKPRRKPHVARTEPLRITSLLDLTFNLLLFFVVTASFTLGEGVLPSKLPQQEGAGQPDDLPQNPINIAITGVAGSYSIRIEGSPVAPRSFEELFRTLDGWRFDDSNPNGIYKDDNPIRIRPSADTAWEHAVNAFNAVVRAKYKDVGFDRIQN